MILASRSSQDKIRQEKIDKSDERESSKLPFFDNEREKMSHVGFYLPHQSQELIGNDCLLCGHLFGSLMSTDLIWKGFLVPFHN